MSNDMPGYQHDDGGRAAAGYKGTAGDCGVRAIAIATGKPYGEVYDALFDIARNWKGNSRKAKAIRAKASPRGGVFPEVANAFLESIGWKQHMVRMRMNEIPHHYRNSVVLAVRKHFTALVDNAIRDTWDCRLTAGGDYGDGYIPPSPKFVTRIWAAA